MNYRMNLLRYAILIIIICAFVIQIPSTSANTENGVKELNIHIPLEKERERFGNRVLVAGIWHYINITLNETASKLVLTIYKGKDIPLIKNETNYYSWEYDGSWKVLRNYGYIDPEKCKKINDTYSFYIGTSNFMGNKKTDYENWTLVIEADNKKIFSTDIVIEKPVSSIAVSRADFTLRCDPFKESILKSSHKFLTRNTGNIPLHISIEYNKLNDQISTSNFNTTLHVNEGLEHSIEIRTDRWQPGFISILGTISADALYVIPTGFISFETTYSMSNVPSILITVGHGGHELKKIGEITFQYEKNVEVKYGEIKNVTAYICGNGKVTLSITNSNITILNVWGKEGVIEDIQNIVINSTNSSEYPIVVQIQANKPNATGYINYNLMVENETKSYTTVIKVGYGNKENSNKEKSNNLMYWIVGLSLFSVIGYIAYNQIRYRI